MSTNPSAVHRLNVHTSAFEPLPQFGGAQAILYRSPDGTRVAGSFRESGAHTVTLTYDEFLFVVAGTVAVTVDGGERQELGIGDALYLTQGATVAFEMSDDFQDVAVLISDQPIEF